MKVNGESIYGTIASPFRRPWWGRCTHKELENGITRLYLQVFSWPEDNKLYVPVNNEAVKCYSLSGDNEVFEVEKAEEGLLVRLTGEAPDKISSVIVLDIKGSPDVPNQNITQNENGVLILKPKESNLENRGYVSTNHAKLIRDKELSYITWKETRTWMEWPVEITNENVFDIYVTIATCSADNKIIIEAGEQKVEFQLPDTKGLGNFKKIRIGTIKISKEISTLIIKGDNDKWQECYMSNIELRPAE
jgi:alpha-L-fucosidase